MTTHSRVHAVMGGVIIVLGGVIAMGEWENRSLRAALQARPKVEYRTKIERREGPVRIVRRYAPAPPPQIVYVEKDAACPLPPPPAPPVLVEEVEERAPVEERTVSEGTSEPVCPPTQTAKTRYVMLGYGPLSGGMSVGAGMSVFKSRFLLGAEIVKPRGQDPAAQLKLGYQF